MRSLGSTGCCLQCLIPATEAPNFFIKSFSICPMVDLHHHDQVHFPPSTRHKHIKIYHEVHSCFYSKWKQLKQNELDGILEKLDA